MNRVAFQHKFPAGGQKNNPARRVTLVELFGNLHAAQLSHINIQKDGGKPTGHKSRHKGFAAVKFFDVELLLLCLLLLSGCTAQAEPVEATFFAMDTIMTLRVYGGDQALLDLIRDNPAGQDRELTPFILIREVRAEDTLG